MSMNSPEIERGREEAIRRQFIEIVNSSDIKRLSAEYLQDKSKAEQVTARVTASLHFRQNGYQFMFQHYIGGPGYEGYYRDSFTRYPILEDGRVGMIGAITIVLREKMRNNQPIEDIKGEEYISDSPNKKPRDLSKEEALEKAEEILASLTLPKPN